MSRLFAVGRAGSREGTFRSDWLLAILLASVAMVGCPRAATPKPPEDPMSKRQTEPQTPKRPEGLVGYYVLDDPAVYGATAMSAAPPGQVMYLGIEDRRWMMRNMLTAYGGSWVKANGGATLTVNVGPTGPTNGSEKIVARRTDRGVELLPPGSTSPAMRFTYVGRAAPKGFGYDEFLDGTK